MINCSLMKGLKLGLMLLCAIVGVGFVSGAEVFSFYVKFGNYAYFGLFIFFVLNLFFLNKILDNSLNSEKLIKMNNFDKNFQNNTFLAKYKIKSILINFNVLMMSSAMFAGLFSLIKNLFKHNYYFIGLIAIFIIFVILFFGSKGLEKFDIFVLILIGFICVVFVNDLFLQSDFKMVENVYFSFEMFGCSAIFAFVYFFMNIIQIQPIVAEIQPNFSVKQRRLFVVLFSIVLTMLLFIFICFLKNNIEIANYEMPFLSYFLGKGKFLLVVFVLGLFLSLVSSLLTCLIGVKNLFQYAIKSNFVASFFAIILSMIFSLIGFSAFVNVVYPVVGVLNFIIFVFL